MPEPEERPESEVEDSSVEEEASPEEEASSTEEEASSTEEEASSTEEEASSTEETPTPPAEEETPPTAAAAEEGAVNEDEEGGDQGDDKEEEEKVEYELTGIEELPDSVKRVKLLVPWSEYDKKTGKIFEDLRESANIEGFRRGKAPMPLVRVRFGRQVEKEALQSLMDNCLEQVLKEKDLTIYQRFDDELPELEQGKDLNFAASFEVKPEIDPTGYDDLEVEIKEIVLDDHKLQKELEMIQRANGKWEARADEEAVGIDDAVTLDTKVTDGEGKLIPELTWENHPLPSLDHLLPEVAEALVGKKKNDEVEVAIPVKKNEDGSLEQPATNWSIKILEVKRLQLPAIDDEFARDVGDFKDLDDLKDRIRRDLERQKEEGERRQTLEKIHTLLLERNQFDLPATLSTITQSDMIRRDIDRLRRSGMSLENLGQTKEEYQGQVKLNADKYLKINLLLEAMADKEKLEVSEEDVETALKRMAEQSGRKPLAIRAQLEAQKRWDGFQDDLRLEKVADFLIERSKVHKIAPSPVDEEQG